jgi:hypothetical protein
MNNGIVHLEEQGVDVDLNKYAVEFNTQEEEYLGGIDSDGHERKDNYALNDVVVSYYYDEDKDTIIRETVNDYESYNSRPASLEEATAEIAEHANAALVYERGNVECDDYGRPIGKPLMEEMKGANEMASEWKNHGDVNFAEEGGVLTRVDNERPQDIEFFQLMIDENEQRYAFHGTVNDINDYADNKILQETAAEFGYASAEDFIKADPEAAAAELVSSWGYGAMEFSATNKDGQGAYSTDFHDFALSEQELAGFMQKLDVPSEMQPTFEYAVTAYIGTNFSGIESTFETNQWSEVESFSHEKLMDGYAVVIEDKEYGKSAELNPDKDQDTFEARNGEFPVDEQYMEVDYGDGKDYED